MPFFSVRCKSPAPCGSHLPTPYFTAQTTPEGMRTVLGFCRPVELTCKTCGFKATYSREDLSVAAELARDHA